MSDNILATITAIKNGQINDFIRDFLGHTPTNEERKEFTIMRYLRQSIIYYQGKLIGYVEAQIDDSVSLADC
jgi:hypothetical protein